jgi:transcriptional regulator with XRE-family HTH domain
MGTHAVQRDATAATVSANVKRLRMKQNLGLRGLSKKLGEVGRPLGHSAVDQIEKATRRVDVDDLLALARALKTSPITLLMPVVDDPTATVTATGFDTKIGPAAFWLWLSADPSGGPTAGLSPAEFMTNAQPEWQQARWIKDGPDGDN